MSLPPFNQDGLLPAGDYKLTLDLGSQKPTVLRQLGKETATHVAPLQSRAVSALWTVVEDSGSIRKRTAVSLRLQTLSPGAQTKGNHLDSTGS